MTAHRKGKLSQANRRFKGHSKRRVKRAAGGRIESQGSGRQVETGALGRDGYGREMRANMAAQRRALKNEEARRRKTLNTPLTVAIIGLNEDTNTVAMRTQLLRACASLKNEELPPGGEPTEWSQPGPITIETRVANSAFSLTLLAPPRDALASLNAAMVADVLLWAVRPGTDAGQKKFETSLDTDELAETTLRMAAAQGLPQSFMVLRGMMDRKQKAQQALRKYAGRFAAEWLPNTAAATRPAFVVDTLKQAEDVVRQLKNVALRSLAWRDSRNYMLLQKARYDEAQGTLTVEGYLRGERLFNVDRLVHITGFDTNFQLAQVQLLRQLRGKKKDDIKEDVQTITPTEQQEDLAQMLEIDPMAREQSIITEEEIAMYEEERRKAASGVADHMKAWEQELGWVPDEEVPDDDEFEKMLNLKPMTEQEMAADAEFLQQRHQQLQQADAQGHLSPGGMADDGDNDDEKRDFVAEVERRREMADNEKEFPDEVDYPPDYPGGARARFAKYRGLKSFRHTPWDKHEWLPLEYSRIFQMDDWAQQQRAVLDEGRMTGVPVQCLARLVLKNVPAELGNDVAGRPEWPWVLSGCWAHEHKVSIVHALVRRTNEHAEPVRHGDPMLWQVGFRRYYSCPVYSDNVPGVDKHKTMKFLPHSNHPSVASMYARIAYNAENKAPLPVLQMLPPSTPAMQRNPVLVATGNFLGTDADRLNIKRVVLTGHPCRVYKHRCVVRYMFFTPRDVRWFRPVELWTKYGLRGRIDDTANTHGYMKCSFNKPVKQVDTVCMSLYKRQFPRFHEHFLQWDCDAKVAAKERQFIEDANERHEREQALRQRMLEDEEQDF